MTIDVAHGLRKYLFTKLHSVVMTSATLCAGSSESRAATRGLNAEFTESTVSGAGVQPMSEALEKVDARFAYIKARLGVVNPRAALPVSSTASAAWFAISEADRSTHANAPAVTPRPRYSHGRMISLVPEHEYVALRSAGPRHGP